MFRYTLLSSFLLIAISCGEDATTSQPKIVTVTSARTLVVSRAGLVTVGNHTVFDTLRLVTTNNDLCLADLIVWSPQNTVSLAPSHGLPLNARNGYGNLPSEGKDIIYIIGPKEHCKLTVCGHAEDGLLRYQPSEIVLGDLPTANTVSLSFVDNHGLNGDSEIDVVVQSWDQDKESFTGNPLKNKNRVTASDIVDNRLNVELTGSTKPHDKHHIWVRHEKGVELERPAIDGWWDDIREP